MPVKDLIAKAKTRTALISLPPKAVKDLRDVLAANDAEPNRLRRVTTAAFLEFLRKEHGVALGEETLKRICARDLGRSWFRP